MPPPEPPPPWAALHAEARALWRALAAAYDAAPPARRAVLALAWELGAAYQRAWQARDVAAAEAALAGLRVLAPREAARG